MFYLKQFFLRFFFVLIFLFIFSFSILQTKWAKNQIKQLIISCADDQGISLSIEEVEGTLPLFWVLREIQTDLPHLGPILIHEAKARLSFTNLCKGVLKFSFFQIEHGLCSSQAFSLKARGKYSPFKQHKEIKIDFVSLENDFIKVQAKALFRPNLTIKRLMMDFIVTDMPLNDCFLKNLKGCMHGNLKIQNHQISFNAHAKEIQWEDHLFSNTSFVIKADLNPGIWKGGIDFSTQCLDLPFKIHSAVFFDPLSYLFTLQDFSVTAPESQLCGSVMFTPTLQFIHGTLFAQLKNLKIFRPFFKNSELSGVFGGKVNFSQETKGEKFALQAELEDFSFKDFSLSQLYLDGNFLNLFSKTPEAFFSIEGENFIGSTLELKNFDLNAALNPSQEAPFYFSANGTWKDPLNIEGKGVWHKEGENYFLQLKQFFGSALNNSFHIQENCTIQWGPDHFKLNNFFLNLAKGYMHCLIDLTSTSTFIKMKADRFPLDFLSISQKDLTFKGSTSFDLDLIAWKKNLQGTLNLTLEQMDLHTHGKQSPLKTKGALQLHLNQNIAQLHAELKSLENQFLDVSATFPIYSCHFPLKIELDKDKAFSSELTMEGKLQDLFDFIHIGAHRFEGWLSGHLFLSKTLSAPVLQGNLELKQGVYENYYTGTSLKQIEAKASAYHQKIEMKSFDAVDEEGGKVSALGVLSLNPKENFPYDIRADLLDFAIISYDSLKGKFTGPLWIHGNQEFAIAEGNLLITHGMFKISDRLPTVIPELPITFINPPEHIKSSSLKPLILFPIYLDVNLYAKEGIFVEGKGLHSEWQGNLHVTGTHIDVKASGKLDLIKGEYLFAGKTFSSNQGEITFNDKSSPKSYISLTGNCDLADVDVKATLYGPLTSPNLSLQSIPQMPTSSLLSHLLFNKNFEEISAVQALQLAQTILSFSQTNTPDFLEKIRNKFKIDRLNIVASEKDPEKISVQIGKYLMQGLLLTFSQGPESRNVSLELQMKHGFNLQAELGEHQGKFSFKLRHHY